MICRRVTVYTGSVIRFALGRARLVSRPDTSRSARMSVGSAVAACRRFGHRTGLLP
jgi:hypothetical protein